MDPLITSPYQDVESLKKWEKNLDVVSGAICSYVDMTRDDSKPKTLLCHDMKGGYLEDRYDQGYPSSDCFHFHHWHLVDIFCYFSHSFVTVPPVTWINAAHKNGVKVLGTIITEWDSGVINTNKILESWETIEEIVKCLVGLAKRMNFEGWLVNIENEVKEEQVEKLVFFVARLTEEMHKVNEHAEVIWYDSVIKTGKLKWQNKLCEENKLFFDACDGIFLNYNWSPTHLQHSIEMAGEQRRHQVYVGVDVFGRGCPGGGGWNTFKALEMIRQHNLSAAIFAFGWVYETLDIKQFRSNNTKYWELLSNYLYPHVIKTLPLITSFCRGYGDAFFVDGQKVQDRGWNNLNLTSLQPTFPDKISSVEGLEVTMKPNYTEDAYDAGSCVLFSGKVQRGNDRRVVSFRLFETNIGYKETDFEEVFFSFSYKHKHGVKIKPSLFVVHGRRSNLGLELYGDDEVFSYYEIKRRGNGWVTMSFCYKLGHDLNIKRISLRLVAPPIEKDEQEFELLLGEIRICPGRALETGKDDGVTKLKPTKIHRHPIEPNRVTFFLSWNTPINPKTIQHYDVYCLDAPDGIVTENLAGEIEKLSGNGTDTQGVFLGRTSAPFYQICNVIVPDNCCDGTLTFSVVPVDMYGKRGTCLTEKLDILEFLKINTETV